MAPKAMFSAPCGAQSHAETIMVPTHVITHVYPQACMHISTHTSAHTLGLTVFSQSQEPGPNTNQRNDEALAVRKQS